MLNIDLRNPAVIGYRYSVVGNNNVDVVCFVSSFVQYATGYKVFVKVEDDERTYVDKIEIASEDITVEEDTLKVQWTMGEVSTQCKRINVQLQFENNDGTLIDQSLIAKITLADSINVDEEASHIYPKVLEDLQEQIDELAQQSGTKLYKHTVVFEDGEHDQYTIVVISTSQQQITSQTFYNDVVSVSNAYKRVSISMSINVSPAYVYGVEGSQQSGKAQFTYFISENNSFEISTGYAMSIVSDTVTEL